jgi:hypothetical protein
MSSPHRDGAAVPLGDDFGGVLPPVPLNRPASAIGWAYAEPGRPGAQGFAPPFQPAGVPSRLRRPPSTVPEDAEVMAVMARTQAYKEQQQQQRQRGLPPPVPEEQGFPGGGQVVSSRLGVSGGSSGNLSSRSAQYGMLVPPSGPAVAATDASAQQGGYIRPASASSLVYEARAKEAEQLYGDRACDMPTQRAFRGCFAPMAAACAPPRGAGEDGDDDVEEGSHGGGGSSLLAEASQSIAFCSGVGGGGEGSAQQTAAAQDAAARRAAFLANVERKKAAAAQTSTQPRRRQAGVDPVAAAAAYLGDANAASRYVYPAAPMSTADVDTYAPGELEWQQQQAEQWRQGQQALGGVADGAAWRARLDGEGGEALAGQPYGGVYAAPRGQGR